MSDLVGNPEDRFSRVEAQIIKLAGFLNIHTSALQNDKFIQKYVLHMKVKIVSACRYLIYFKV